jgi:hypothetical protein
MLGVEFSGAPLARVSSGGGVRGRGFFKGSPGGGAARAADVRKKSGAKCVEFFDTLARTVRRAAASGNGWLPGDFQHVRHPRVNLPHPKRRRIFRQLDLAHGLQRRGSGSAGTFFSPGPRPAHRAMASNTCSPRGECSDGWHGSCFFSIGVRRLRQQNILTNGRNVSRYASGYISARHRRESKPNLS